MSELHVVACSGGKDSTAMALRLAEIEPRQYHYMDSPTRKQIAAEYLRRQRAQTSLVEYSQAIEIPGRPVNDREDAQDGAKRVMSKALDETPVS